MYPATPESNVYLQARHMREAAAMREAEEKRKSKALQLHLPRPATLDRVADIAPPEQLEKLSYREKAEHSLNQELLRLLQHDASQYPLNGEAKKKGGKVASQRAFEIQAPPMDVFADDELAAATVLVEEEMQYVRQAMGHATMEPHEWMELWLAAKKDFIWLPSSGMYVRAPSAAPSDRISAAESEFQDVREAMERQARRAAKLEQKVGILTSGLQQRGNRLETEVVEKFWPQLQESSLEFKCFGVLKQREMLTGPERLHHLLQVGVQA